MEYLANCLKFDNPRKGLQGELVRETSGDIPLKLDARLPSMFSVSRGEYITAHYSINRLPVSIKWA